MLVVASFSSYTNILYLNPEAAYIRNLALDPL
jgi:hypothetical protein